jgi:hypothetical protein
VLAHRPADENSHRANGTALLDAAAAQGLPAVLVDILGLRPATTCGPFRVVALANGVSLDVVGSDGPFPITQSGSLEHHPHRPAPAAACDDMAEPDLGRPG